MTFASNGMDKKNTYIIAAITILAIIGFIVISLQKTTLDTQAQNALEVASTTEWANAPAVAVITHKTVVTAKHAYRNGEHIIAGEVPLSSPCELLEASATVSTDKKSVLVQLVAGIKSGETCPPSITPTRFKLSGKAEKSATLGATYNGQTVTLNLIEAGPSENLDDFELYIKG